MKSVRRTLELLAAFIAAAFLFCAITASASAQTAPYTAYGTGQRPEAIIAANIAGKSCGPGVVATAGAWVISIAAAAPCSPKEGDVLSFTFDGVPATQRSRWRAGGSDEIQPAVVSPYTAYGTGQRPGVKIAANIYGKSCGFAAVVDASGNWKLAILSTDLCSPEEGDVLSFTFDGVPATQRSRWRAGGSDEIQPDSIPPAAPTTTSNARPPYTAYGTGQRPGVSISANIAGKSCGFAAVVDASGNWKLAIATTDACTPKEGDTVGFTVNGADQSQTVKWTAGGAPADAAKGIVLTPPSSGPTGVFAGGPIVPRGLSIVSFTGTTDQLDTASRAARVVSVLATKDGKYFTFVVNAPVFVNSDFLRAFSSGLNGTFLLVKTGDDSGTNPS